MNKLIHCLLLSLLSTTITAFAQTSRVKPTTGDIDMMAINIVSNNELSAAMPMSAMV